MTRTNRPSTRPPAPAQPSLRERLLAVRPRSVGPSTWVALRDQAVDLVLSTDPDERSGGPMLSRLLTFAAAHPGVAEQQGLAALLTDARIDEWAPAGAGRASTTRARTDLRRLARAAGTRPGRVVLRHPQPIRAAAGFWPAVIGLGPFCALAAAYEQPGTHRVQDSMWAGLEPLAPESWQISLLAATAGEVDSSTLAGVQAAARAMRAAATQPPRQVISANTSGSQAAPDPRAGSGSRAGRSTSRTAAARAARAAHARATSPTEAAVLADLPSLDEGVAAAIAGYEPHGLAGRWPLIADATRAALAAYSPPSTQWLSSAGGHVARYAASVHARRADQGAPLAPVELVAPGLVDEYVATGLSGTPDSSRATIRSVLRRVVRGLTGTRQPKLGHSPVQPPYSPEECAAFVRLARNQPKDAGRRALCAVVGLGLGAGLDGREQRAVTPGHCRDVDLGDGSTGLAVSVEGPRARVVVVRAEYEPLVREAMRLHAKARRGKGTPLHGESLTRRNVTSTVTSQAVTATGVGVDISAARLRSTWLVALMSAPVPLGALLRAAGLTGARTLVDLLPHCPEPDPADVERAVRAAADATEVAA